MATLRGLGVGGWSTPSDPFENMWRGGGGRGGGAADKSAEGGQVELTGLWAQSDGGEGQKPDGRGQKGEGRGVRTRDAPSLCPSQQGSVPSGFPSQARWHLFQPGAPLLLCWSPAQPLKDDDNDRSDSQKSGTRGDAVWTSCLSVQASLWDESCSDAHVARWRFRGLSRLPPTPWKWPQPSPPCSPPPPHHSRERSSLSPS